MITDSIDWASGAVFVYADGTSEHRSGSFGEAIKFEDGRRFVAVRCNGDRNGQIHATLVYVERLD